MSMFCYQCQETAMGTGCTLKGVCGKTSEVANLQDLLLFVVRGIAVYNEHLRKDGHPSEQADKFIYDALFITITNANFDKVAITEKIKEGLQLKKELVYREFVQRENNLLRAPYNPEVSFYTAIKEGDVAKVDQLCQESLLDKEGLGTLSDHYLQNIKYHYVITTAIIARYCIEGGMELSNAYSLSDFYIQKADRCKTPEEVAALHPAMCMDYAKRMRNLRKSKISSLHIAVCLDYIYDHLHTHITAEQLAKLTGLNISYLSRLFKKETGQTISNYIRDKKIETAKNMLLYSDFSPSEIASILAFSSQSYFTEVFRKTTGVTPRKYQESFLRTTALGK